MKKSAPKQRVIQHFCSIGRAASAIEVRIVVWNDDGIPKLDLRRYVSTSKYTGPTKSGVTLTVEEFATLLKFQDEILSKFREVWRDEPWPTTTDDSRPPTG